MNKNNYYDDTVYDNYELYDEVSGENCTSPSKIESGIALVDSVNNFMQSNQETMNMAKDIWNQSKQIELQAKQIDTWGNVQIAKTIAKFKTCQDFLERSFGERSGALNKNYEVLDNAVATGDREQILAVLKSISSIVTSSPLDDFEKFSELYDDESQPLLDF